MALPPAAPTCAAVSLTRSAERAAQTTRAPSRAKRRLMTRPMPVDAPVTMATFPSSKPIRNLPVDLLDVDLGGARPGPAPARPNASPGSVRERGQSVWPSPSTLWMSRCDALSPLILEGRDGVQLRSGAKSVVSAGPPPPSTTIFRVLLNRIPQDAVW